MRISQYKAFIKLPPSSPTSNNLFELALHIQLGSDMKKREEEESLTQRIWKIITKTVWQARAITTAQAIRLIRKQS